MKTINVLILAAVVALTSACAHHKCDDEPYSAETGGDMPMMDGKMHEHMQAAHEKMQKIHENMDGMQNLILTIQQTRPSATRTKMLEQHMAMLQDTTNMLHDMSMMKDMHEDMKGDIKDKPMMSSAQDDQHTMPAMDGMKKCDMKHKARMSGAMGMMMQHMDMMQVLLQQQMMLHQMAAGHHGK